MYLSTPTQLHLLYKGYLSIFNVFLYFFILLINFKIIVLFITIKYKKGCLILAFNVGDRTITNANKIISDYLY